MYPLLVLPHRSLTISDISFDLKTMRCVRHGKVMCKEKEKGEMCWRGNGESLM